MRPMLQHLLPALALSIAAAGAAQAQKAPPPASAPANVEADPMRISVMRSQEPGCGPVCPEWISLQGNFSDDSVRQFRRVVEKLGKRKLPVVLHSAGGRIKPAMEIGRIVRRRGLDVVLAKASLVRCTSDVDSCKRMVSAGIEPGKVELLPLEKHVALCSTACAMVLAAGAQRHVGANALVGFTPLNMIETHRRVRREYQLQRTGGGFFTPPEVKRKLVNEDILSEKEVRRPAEEKDFAVLAKYFKEMGIADGLITYLRQTTGGKQVTLTRAQLLETKLATGTMTGVQYFLPQPPAAVAVPPAGTVISPAPAPAAKSVPAAAPSPAPAVAAPAAPASAAGGPAAPLAASPGPDAEPAKPQPPPAAAKPRPKAPPKPAARPSGDPPVSSVFQ